MARRRALSSPYPLKCMQFPSICSVLLYGRQKEHGERTAAPPVDGTLQLEEGFVGFIPYLGGLVRWVWFAWVWELLPGSFIGLHDR
jgi:hypothetical protein